jgi:hypothetical protein
MEARPPSGVYSLSGTHRFDFKEVSMNIRDILTTVYSYSQRIGRTPCVQDPRLTSIAKEGQRKIGRWRKVLWLSGAIPDERQRQLPQVSFACRAGRWEFDQRSHKLLKKLCPSDPARKERIVL